MHKRLAVLLVGMVWPAVFAGPAWSADVVYRKSSKIASQGRITGISKTELTIQSRAKSKPVKKIPANDIKRVRWDKEPPALNLVRINEQSGLLEKAFQGYTKALKGSGGSNRNLKTDLEFLLARTKAKMALADPTKINDAVNRLEAFRKSNANHFRHYEALDYLVRLYMAKNDYANARTVLNLSARAPWPDYKLAVKIVEARLLLKEDKVALALAAFGAIANRPAQKPDELNRRYEAMLGQATCLQQQKQLAEAVGVLEKIDEQAPPEERRLRAETYVRKGDCLRLMGKTKEAVLAYLHIEVLFSGEKALHAESLYQLSQLWVIVEEPGKAAATSAKLQADYPDSKWAQKLAAGGG